MAWPGGLVALQCAQDPERAPPDDLLGRRPSLPVPCRRSPDTKQTRRVRKPSRTTRRAFSIASIVLPVPAPPRISARRTRPSSRRTCWGATRMAHPGGRRACPAERAGWRWPARRGSGSAGGCPPTSDHARRAGSGRPSPRSRGSRVRVSDDQVRLALSQASMVRSTPDPLDVGVQAVLGRQRRAHALDHEPLGLRAGSLVRRLHGRGVSRQSHPSPGRFDSSRALPGSVRCAGAPMLASRAGARAGG